MKPLAFDAELRARLALNLARSEHAPLAERGLKRAAVCIIVTGDDRGEASLVLTLRTEHLSSHPSQFALPGGRIERGESALDAARRETREEIDLELAPANFLGRLDDYATRSGYVITPLVAWCAGTSQLKPNPAEVAQIYRVPLADLGRPDSPEFVAIPESAQPVVRYPLRGTRRHSPTAAGSDQFMEVALLGRATRVAHLEQPVWAWR